jgi:hypothetical protein
LVEQISYSTAQALSFFSLGHYDRHGVPKPIQMSRPPIHHLHPLIPMLATGIGASDIIAFDMRQLPLDRIGVP